MRGLLLALVQAVAGEWLFASSFHHNSGSRLEFVYPLLAQAVVPQADKHPPNVPFSAEGFGKQGLDQGEVAGVGPPCGLCWGTSRTLRLRPRCHLPSDKPPAPLHER